MTRRAKFLVTSLVIGVALMVATGAQANPLNEDVAKANEKFQTFATLLGRLDELTSLDEQLPLADKSLAEVLEIAKIFDDDGRPDDASFQSLKERLDAATDSNWENLGAALDALDCNAATCGVDVKVTGPGTADDGSDPVYVHDSNPSADDQGTVDIALEVKVTGTNVPVPLVFANDLINLSGGTTGTFPLNVELKTTVLHFEIDKAKLHNADAGVQSQAVALRLMPTDTAVPVASQRQAPAFLFSASATDVSLGGFNADLGIVQVQVAGNVSFDIDGRADLQDPDDSDGSGPLMGDGYISADEWATTSFATLLNARLEDDGATNAVSASVRMSTDLVPDSLDGPDSGTDPDHDASISYVDASLIDANAPVITTLPDATFGQVGNFRNMTPGEAVASLMRLLQFLDGLQATDRLDLDLPLIGGAAANPADPASSPSGTFSDALRLSDELKKAITEGPNKLMTLDNPATPEVEESQPTFTNIQTLATKLGNALGAPGSIVPTFIPSSGPTVPARVDFTLALGKTATAQINPAFDNLDILSAIQVTSSPFNLSARYDLTLPFGLSLKTQPVESGGPIGSCNDEQDNDGDTVIDADDPDCANVETIQQRVGVKVGTGAPADVPEIRANVRINGTGINANARIGILEAGIDNASLQVSGKLTGEGTNPTDTIATCSDGTDNDGDGKQDEVDPDCNAGIVVDFKDTADGFLSVEDLFNTMGAGSVPTGASFTAVANAAFAATVPVDANVGTTNLANGTIKVTAQAPNVNLLAPGSGMAALVDSVKVDASDLHTREIFNFSPCSNNRDDDGDGKVNDGCAQAGNAPESGADCDNDTNDDASSTDTIVNDGCPANDDSETQSTRLFNQIVDALRGLTGVLESTGLIDGDRPIPLIDKSYNELLGYVEVLEGLAGGMSTGAESALPGNACSNNKDDDHDGYINDGCPTQGAAAELAGISTQGDQCAKGEATNSDPADDSVINDGCPPKQPTLSDVAAQIDGILDQFLDGLPGANAATDHATVGLVYNAADNSIRFDVHAAPSISRTVPLNLDLGSGNGSLVSLNSAGDLTAALTGALDLDFGVEVDTATPFLLDTSGLTVNASAQSHNLSLQAGVGPMTILVGDLVARPETNCANNVDDDGDGFVNDGCIAQDGTDDGDAAASESGAECANDTNDDTSDADSFVNDGCPAKADPAKFDLSGAFSVAVNDDATDHKLYISELNAAAFQVNVGGTPDPDCNGVATQTLPAGTDKHACAVLPLFFDADGPDGPTPPTPLGDAPNRGHQLRVAVADLSSPTIDYSNYNFDAITDQIAANVIDMLLLNSGLQNLIDMLRGVLNQELFGFNLPFIGDQLSNAADIVDTLETVLKQKISDAMAGENPMNGSIDARQAQEALEGFRAEVGGLLAGAGILLNQAGTAAGTADDFKIELRCKQGTGPVEACDTGGEDDAYNLAAGANGGTAANCANDTDDDNDGVINDGCPAEGNFPEPDCSNNADDVDENPDPDPAAIDPDDARVNDGCPNVVSHRASEVYDIRFAAKLGKLNINLADESLNFDIGVPGLGLQTQNASLTGNVHWKIDIGFGISKDPDLGFYLVTDPNTGDSVDPAELEVGGTVGVTSDAANPAQITANLGFLRVTAIDGDPDAMCATSGPTGTDPCRPQNDTVDDPASSLTLNFSINVKDPDTSSPDGLLAFNELGSASFTDVLAFRLSAVADVNFHIETSIAGTGATLPRLFADLHLDWSFHIGTDQAGNPVGGESTNVSDLNPNGAGSNLAITLDSVTLDAGTFVTKFLKPILSDVQRFTKPFQPLIDKLNAPIPVLSDLAGSPITLLDLAETLAPDEYNVDLIVAVVKIVDFVNTFDVSGTGNMQIPLGGVFNLAATDLQKGGLAEGDARKAFANASELAALDSGSLLGAISGATAPGATPERQVSSLSSVGVTFPFVDQPSKLLGILFKQDVDLIRFETSLSVGFSYSQKFGPIWQLPPVFLEIGGSLNASIKFGIGYDTQGLRELLFEDASADALLHGLFLIDYPGNEAELRGELFANAQVSLVIFSAGAGGSVYLTIGIDLNDPNNDGKLKWQEASDILRTTGSPLCLFILNGQFGVRIFVFAEVDLFFWSQRWEKTLADIVLFEFKVQCDPLPEPILAHPDGTTLVLHLGIDEGLRDTPANSGKSIGHDVIDEKFVVTRVKLPNASGVVVDGVTVEAFGVTQFYPGNWTKILARDAGSGNDVITLADGNAGAETQCADSIDNDNDGLVNDGCPKAGATPEGSPSSTCANGDTVDDDGDGFVNDGCKAKGDPLPFDIASELHGGGGNDQLTGGERATAGAGDYDDKLYGDAGDDVINAREGRALIVGGPGKDKLGAGRSPDTIWGDNENNSGSLANDDTNADTIDGGAEADKLHGGPGPDMINGGLASKDPKTKVVVPDKADTINGDAGNDTIEAGDGADIVNGGTGGDRISGGYGNDVITGGDESEESVCNANTPVDDTIVGGPDADTINAGAGDDVVVGGNVVAGEPDTGDLKLDGGSGCDDLYGDNATPNPNATNQRVLLLIDAHIGDGDKMAGGNGSDRLHGQRGADVIRGDDFLTNNLTVPNDDAGDGNDELYGHDGDDLLFGDGGGDKVVGAAGADDIVGGLGADTLRGDAGEDIMIGDDGYVTRTATPSREDDAETLSSSGSASEDHKDTMFGGTDRDRMYGELSADTMRGDEADDDMYGNEGADIMNGNTGNDLMFGNNGADQMFGDAGNDRMIGGSPNATTDDIGEDKMYGRFGLDVMAGDNATITPAGVVTLLAETTANKGDGDLMYGEEHADVMYGGLGNDRMYGNADDDYMEGNADQDAMEGNAGDDDMIGGTRQAGPAGLVDAEGEGGQLDDKDTMKGGTGHDVMLGDNGSITRTGNASPILNGAEERDVELFDLDSTNAALSGDDVMDGNSENDELYGGGDVDTMHGNAGDDHLEGNGGADKVWGDAGQDDVIGGTSAEAGNDSGGAHPDGADELFGDTGSTSQTATAGAADVIAGDNASIQRVVVSGAVVEDDLDPTRSGYDNVVRRVVTLYDVATVASPNPLAPGSQPTSGGETIYAEGGRDIVYGQGGVDTLHGQDKDDYLEGNADGDFLYGEAGQDDLIGGTGRTKSDDPSTAADGRKDGDDRLYGGNGSVEASDEDAGSDAAPVDSDDFDVLMGDNATILRDLEPAQGDHEWEVNTFNASIKRAVFLYDVAVTGVGGDAPRTNGTTGADTMQGEADADVLYGQGGNDTMDGNGDDDYMEGNDGNDTIRGGVGSDDILGGTGQINGEGLDVDGRLDLGETLVSGGQGFDVMAGDNAVIRRVFDSEGRWVRNTFNLGVQHERIFLRDLDDTLSPAAAGTNGGETLMTGDGEDDVVYGQGENDTIQGNLGDDYIEGNGGADAISGNEGEDDVLGGTGRVNNDGPSGTDGRFDGGDTISGEAGVGDGTASGDGGDVVLGDNGVIERRVDGAGAWRTSPANGVTVRRYVMRDLELFGVVPGAAAGTSGGDTVYGNDNDDVLYGQGGDDTVHGGAGGDYVEGNFGADTLFGGPGQDDLIGGTGRDVDEESWIETTPPQEGVDGRLDGNDAIHGGDGADFATGDNGLVQRREKADGTWRRFVDANPDTIVRVVTRRDVGGSAGTFGADVMNGDEGDDVLYGQDGSDTLHGDADNNVFRAQDNDDLYGELGDDFLFGDEGEDAMVGDRGNIVNTRLKDDSKKLSYDTQGPAFFKYTGLVAGQLDRRVSLSVDGDDAPGNPQMGQFVGGGDRMRGGPGHDSMHGAFGDDLMNGDSGGDWLFGADGADAMWGGKGADNSSIDPADHIKVDDGIALDPANTRGKNDRFVDYLFGAHGGLQPDEVDAADKLDFRPRSPGAGFPGDPAEWFVMTSTNDAEVANNQHHQGIDWIYGGWDRDVLEGNIGKNGPDFGDRLIDWKGAYNLYTRCNASYGDDGDIYQITPQLMELLQAMAYGSGAGDNFDEVKTPGTSAFRELGLVYPNDPGNRGKAFPSTPGHFEQIDCTP